MKLTTRGWLVLVVIPAIILTALVTYFASNYHSVIDTDTCKWSDEANAMMCDFHYEHN